mmetsp:Transcript_6614/g.18321  ORF Transcript_6614/g.18321 Transcript_6614/m.18321 type:complete len:330 (-) Transcript_6614:2599-3588(-)
MKSFDHVLHPPVVHLGAGHLDRRGTGDAAAQARRLQRRGVCQGVQDPGAKVVSCADRVHDRHRCCGGGCLLDSAVRPDGCGDASFRPSAHHHRHAEGCRHFPGKRLGRVPRAICHLPPRRECHGFLLVAEQHVDKSRIQNLLKDLHPRRDHIKARKVEGDLGAAALDRPHCLYYGRLVHVVTFEVDPGGTKRVNAFLRELVGPGGAQCRPHRPLTRLGHHAQTDAIGLAGMHRRPAHLHAHCLHLASIPLPTGISPERTGKVHVGAPRSGREPRKALGHVGRRPAGDPAQGATGRLEPVHYILERVLVDQVAPAKGKAQRLDDKRGRAV